MPTLRSQAHLQVTQADTRPKPAKELVYPNAQSEKYAAKMKDRITKKKRPACNSRSKRIKTTL